MFRAPFLAFAAVILCLALPGRAQDDLIDEINEEILAGDNAWWNAAWRYRQRVIVADPATKVRRTNYLLLKAPDPLFLYNTGRAKDGLADLRAVAMNGQEVPCGVINFGQDDGSSYIWCFLPQAEGPMTGNAPPRITLYYGNPDAESPNRRQPGELSAPMLVELEPEKLAPGAKPGPPPDASAFLRGLIVVEAELLQDEQGRTAHVHPATPNRRLYDIAHDAPSGGYYAAPDVPWRPIYQKDYPVTASGTVNLPAAGTWYVHVRYKVSEYVLYANGEPKRPILQMFPFRLRVGDRELTCGANQKHGVEWRYDRFAVELPAGESPLQIVFDKCAGPDVIVFTQDAAYRPDIADFNGPVWARFRIDQAPVERFHVAPFCVIQPWSSHGPQGEFAGYLFRDRVALNITDRDLIMRDPNAFLAAGEWTPWIQLLHSQMPTWWTHLRVYPMDGRSSSQGLDQLTVSFEFATRPSAERIFSRGSERTGEANGLNFLMPRSTNLASMLSDTLSFGQWARKRYELAKSLGYNEGEGPKRVLVTTMATSQSPEEAEYIMATCAALGFNGIDMRAPMPRDAFWEMAEKHGLPWGTAHHWGLKIDYAAWPTELVAGKTAEETVKALVDQAADGWYSPGGRWQSDTDRTRLLIMGDEIGPATNPPMINAIPVLKQWFHDYLRENGLSPDFFGKATWEEIDAFWYTEVSPDSELGRALTAIRAGQGTTDQEPVDPDAPPELPELALDAAPSADELLAQMMTAEEERQAAERTVQDPRAAADLFEKRLYHWSQKFRGHYTYYVYGQANREIRESAAAGNFRHPPFANPNFQALPIMRSQMWDGALNMFEWARTGTTDFLFMEDWIMHPYRVAFGFRTMQAAARKHDQKLGLLIVGGNMEQRYLAALANGSQVFLSYLYGPLRVIGPPWAEHEETLRQWADILRATRRCEDDILASKSRPADAAILWAVTNDLNNAYINYSYRGYPMSDRAALFVALQDSQVPVDVVSEEEVIEDEALDRYKVLYVGDLHVDSRAQEKIRAWVERGGTLWGNYAALARQEYDQPTDRFDAVFGLAKRPPIATVTDAESALPPQRITVAGGDGLLPVEFDGTPLPITWQLADGTEVLARFADGRPAFIHHPYGKGQAYLYAGGVNELTGGYSRDSEEPDWAAGARRLVSIAADRAGARRHLALDRPRVMSFVNDGPDQTVVFLINCFAGDITGLQVDVALDRPPTSAFTGKEGDLRYTWADGRARFTVDIPQRRGRIIVFRYR